MRLSTLLLAATCLLFTACEEADIADEASLVGTWEMVEARRNNTPTNTLDNMTFQFGADGSFNTNMMQNETPGSYTVVDETIVTEGVDIPLIYELRELTDSSLVVRTEFRDFQFDFNMRKRQ